MGLEILKRARGTSKHDSCAKNSLRLFNVTRHMSGETFQFPTVNARFKRKQTRENVCGLCLDANCCNLLDYKQKI
jgi:hypothetical protein